ncbi:MAG: selenium metabolism-associated LysR family transcriptional regulator [Thermodesulfobacteriota bacterium]|nr:selenium metabolism-associated LysR family transcriptional regulator [Thermodesulfobacteriota bacterium]
MKKDVSHHKPSVDFDLRQLETFCQIVELGSFSKAANAVFLTQASVSERISNLENMVGTRLLDRLGRQIVPTKAGKLLYKHAVMLLNMKRTAQLEMQDFLGIKRGKIHMGGSTIPGEYILPKFIGRFHAQYPLVSVLLTIADTSEIESRVVEGDLEMGVIGSMGSHRSLIYHELWKDELVLAVPAQHRWAKKKTVSLEELIEEPFILREPGSGTLKIIENHLRDSMSMDQDSLQVVARFGTSTAVKEGIKAGLGVSILSSKAINTELIAGILKGLRLKGINILRSFYLIRDKRRITSPLSQAMVDFLLTTSEE